MLETRIRPNRRRIPWKARFGAPLIVARRFRTLGAAMARPEVKIIDPTAKAAALTIKARFVRCLMDSRIFRSGFVTIQVD
jgi:hypothetical protein